MESEPKSEIPREIVILDASPDDALAYRELERDVWQETYVNKNTGITKEDVDWYFNDFKHAFSPEMIGKFAGELEQLDGSQKAIVVKEGDRIVATAWLIKRGDYNELGSIYVHPDFQRQGTGKRIWEKALEYFDPSKPTVVSVNKQNESAIAYYLNLGFIEEAELTHELRFPSGAEFQEIRMTRPPDTA